MHRCLQWFGCVVQLQSALATIGASFLFGPPLSKSIAFGLSLVVCFHAVEVAAAIVFLLHLGDEENNCVRISIEVLHHILLWIMGIGSGLGTYTMLHDYNNWWSSVLLSLALLQVFMIFLAVTTMISGCYDQPIHSNHRHHQQQLISPEPESPPPAYETLMVGAPPTYHTHDVNTTVVVIEQQEAPSYATTNSSSTDDTYWWTASDISRSCEF